MSLVIWEAGEQIGQVRRDLVPPEASKVPSCSGCRGQSPRFPGTSKTFHPPFCWIYQLHLRPQPGHVRRRVHDTRSTPRHTNPQASLSHIEASPVLADLSVHPTAPRSGTPFAAIGLPGPPPWPPPSSPSFPFSPHMRKGLSRRLSRAKRDRKNR